MANDSSDDQIDVFINLWQSEPCTLEGYSRQGGQLKGGRLTENKMSLDDI